MFRKKDIIIYIIVLLLAGAAYIIPAAVLHGRPAASAVRVSVDGVTYAEYPLDVPLKKTIPGYGGGELALTIAEGKASVESSSCPDKICVRHSAVSYSGECIICMPNRIVIEVIPDEETPGIDAVS